MLVIDPDAEDLLARASAPADEALRLHPYYRGKVQMMPKCPVRGLEDFSIWYTPGVAARALAGFAERRGIDASNILPRMDEWESHLWIATAVGGKAQELGLAGLERSGAVLYEEARLAVRNARDATAALMREQIIPDPPAKESRDN